MLLKVQLGHGGDAGAQPLVKPALGGPTLPTQASTSALNTLSHVKRTPTRTPRA